MSDVFIMCPRSGNYCTHTGCNVNWRLCDEQRSLASDRTETDLPEEKKQEWISVKERLPEPKKGWSHSDQVLLWYRGTENHVESYGIGYYHYNPPFDDPKWTDFHYAKSRQPDAWQHLPEPPNFETMNDEKKQAIRPEELRIGNWVRHPHSDEIYQTEEISSTLMVRGIPLSPEWLERLGFEVEYTNGGFLRWRKGQFKLLDRRLPHPQYHAPEAIILYVHQLQNLYFALTGQELKLGGVC